MKWSRDSGTTGIRDNNRLRIAIDAAGVALCSWNVDSDQIELDERARLLRGVTTLAMVGHELATNSPKCGALSSRVGPSPSTGPGKA